ncbi:MAG: hypothetical protein HETSPECPRED_008443 [Heterodermia speciosa]|uniref:N-alpha-acetyltransferase 40 n=1 Tax=Heterodermia speciosa TaxID=116794 RepID=A0A8H3G1A4_9LECA|nr:MAG: hypothetical protein HETSPECPRED_008443 [Heterodermia speciosa]
MPHRLPKPLSDNPFHSFEEPSPPSRPVSPIESLNTLDEDDFRTRFLPLDRHFGGLCCNGKVNKGRYNRYRCQSSQPAEELFITLDPAPEDTLEEGISREDAWESGLAGVPRSLPAQYLIRFHTASNIRPEDFEACFKLVERTSSLDYKASSVGWSAAKKRQEMADPDMKYLLLTTYDGESLTPVYRVHGFLSFMLTREDELPVVYCYEIHLWPSLRGRGIGSKLMRLMEDIGQQAGVQGSMLTVFTKNEVAKKMYERMGYGVHDSSPGPRRLRGGRTKKPDYQILWKTIEGEWNNGEGEESSEEASTQDGDSASEIENEGMDIEDGMDVEEEIDLRDDLNEGQDVMDVKTGAMNVHVKGEEEKLMAKNVKLDVAVKDEHEEANTKAEVEGIETREDENLFPSGALQCQHWVKSRLVRS